mmetsp:Transcript_34126/g.74288  ORF Transcript_34126/g.74288 Transcript_34126/m.74288 type:complete len:95 (-) Transcript_34126:7-291(-)
MLATRTLTEFAPLPRPECPNPILDGGTWINLSGECHYAVIAKFEFDTPRRLRWTNFDAVLHFCCSFGGMKVMDDAFQPAGVRLLCTCERCVTQV